MHSSLGDRHQRSVTTLARRTCYIIRTFESRSSDEVWWLDATFDGIQWCAVCVAPASRELISMGSSEVVQVVDLRRQLQSGVVWRTSSVIWVVYLISTCSLEREFALLHVSNLFFWVMIAAEGVCTSIGGSCCEVIRTEGPFLYAKPTVCATVSGLFKLALFSYNSTRLPWRLLSLGGVSLLCALVLE